MNYEFSRIPNTCTVVQNDLKRRNLVRSVKLFPLKSRYDGDVVDGASNRSLQPGIPNRKQLSIPNQRCSSKELHTHDESLKFERERLNTFIDWPIDWLSPSCLAKEGFYYLRKEDHVACIFCHGIIGAWEVGDVPKLEHKKHYKCCLFVNNQPVGNIPIPLGDLIVSIQIKDYTQVKGATSLPIHKPPVYPLHVTAEGRLKTFSMWPNMVKQDPAVMAEAGFVYIGTSDHVRCFHCGQGLRNWEETDDPWVEHAKWYPDCEYVRFVKTSSFVEKILKSHPHSAHQSAFALNTSADTKGDNLNKKASFTESQLDALMELDIPKAAIKMDFSKSLVRAVLEQRLRTTGLPFFNLEGCIANIWQIMDSENLQKTSVFARQSSVESQSSESITSETSSGPSSVSSEPWSITSDLSSSSEQSSITSEPSSVTLEPSPTTSEPQSPTTSEPQSPTTSEPQSPTTSEPQSPTTSEPQSPTTSEPQSPTTSEPQSPTTSEPQYPTTSEPQYPTTSEPQYPTTSEPQYPTTSELSIAMLHISSENSVPTLIHCDDECLDLSYSHSFARLPKETHFHGMEEKIALLEREIEVLKDQRLCRVCMDREMTLVFLPCQHMATCAACGVALKDCPICRAEIVHIIRPNIVA